MIQKHEITIACKLLRELNVKGLPGTEHLTTDVINFIETSAMQAMNQETRVQFGIDKSCIEYGINVQNKITPGDMVLVEFTHGLEGEFLIGRFERYNEDDPSCIIDGKVIDLASEGHSTKMHKLTHFGNTVHELERIKKVISDTKQYCGTVVHISDSLYEQICDLDKDLQLVRPVPAEKKPVKLVAYNCVFELEADHVKKFLQVGSKVTTDFVERDKNVVRTVTKIMNSQAMNGQTGINVCADDGNKLGCTSIQGRDGNGIDLDWFKVIEF